MILTLASCAFPKPLQESSFCFFMFPANRANWKFILNDDCVKFEVIIFVCVPHSFPYCHLCKLKWKLTDTHKIKERKKKIRARMRRISRKVVSFRWHKQKWKKLFLYDGARLTALIAFNKIIIIYFNCFFA